MRWFILGLCLFFLNDLYLRCDDQVKKIASFEPEQLEAFKWKKQDHKTYLFKFSNGSMGASENGDATDGEWAVVKHVTTLQQVKYINGGAKNNYWLAYLHGGIIKWPGSFKKWFETDWSGYKILRIDFKTSKAKARVKLMLYDEIAFPPITREYMVSPDGWVTLEVDLEAASAVQSMPLSAENQKLYNTDIAKVRLFNPARMNNLMIYVDSLEEPSDLLIDHIRLLKERNSEEAKLKVLTDTRPFLQAKELPFSAGPKPHEQTAPTDIPEKGAEEVITIILSDEKQPAGGPLNRFVQRAITTAGWEKLIYTQAPYIPKFSLDGGKTWTIEKKIQHSGFAAARGITSAGQDILGVYIAHCGGGSVPGDLFYRDALYNGTDWVQGEPWLVEPDSWHCPEYQIEVIRLPSGRIWAAWMNTGRSLDFTIKAKYSDDGGKVWRFPYANGIIDYQRATGLSDKTVPLPVTWWWEEPKIATPSVAHANGSISVAHPHSNITLTRYKGQVAAIFSTDYKTTSWSYFDGKHWAEPQLVANKLASQNFATTLGEEEINFIMANTIYRLDKEGWIEDKPNGQNVLSISSTGSTLICIGSNALDGEQKGKFDLWISDRKQGDIWSEPKVFATEDCPEQHVITVSTPRFTSENFLPIAWAASTKGAGKADWVRIKRFPINVDHHSSIHSK